MNRNGVRVRLVHASRRIKKLCRSKGGAGGVKAEEQLQHRVMLGSAHAFFPSVRSTTSVCRLRHDISPSPLLGWQPSLIITSE
jgi:hypothetical protein